MNTTTILNDVLLNHSSLHGAVRAASQEVLEIIVAFKEKINQCLPTNIYAAWFVKEGEFARLGKVLLKDFNLQPKPGYKLTETFYMTSARSYKLEDFIEKNFGYKIHFGDGHHTLSYSADKFFQLAQVAVAMTLFKYGATNLTRAHIYC